MDCATQCLSVYSCDRCFECSALFDPLGPQAENDEAKVGQLGDLLVRAEDTGNRPAGAPPTLKLPVATMDTASVKMFVYDGPNDLLVNDDSDPACDALNPILVPKAVPMTANEMAVVNLAPILPSGDTDKCTTAICGSTPFGDPDDAIDDDLCIHQALLPLPFPAVCAETPITRVVAAEDGNGAAIYSIPPLGCMGNPFDFLASNQSEGWVC
ncbi:MAG: hypothetical protein ACREE7_05080, partial [Dongiaceae bacterium]